MNLSVVKKLPNAPHSIHETLLQKTERLVREERRISVQVLECLQEIESKMIYADLAYSSMYEFCVKHLKYSEGAAHRRISAMRILKDLPEKSQYEFKERVKNGSLSVSNLSLMNGFFKLEKKEHRKIYSPKEKADFIQVAVGSSKLELEKRLSEIQPRVVHHDVQKVLTPELTEIKFIANEELVKKLERVREVTSNAIPDARMDELISRLVDDYLKRHDPMMKWMKK